MKSLVMWYVALGFVGLFGICFGMSILSIFTPSFCSMRSFSLCNVSMDD